MSRPAVRLRIPLGAGFLENYHVSPLSILGHFNVVSLGKALYPPSASAFSTAENVPRALILYITHILEPTNIRGAADMEKGV